MNYTLVKQVASLERQCWRNALYSRRESVDITGMSNWIVHSVLEKTACKRFQHIGADIFWGETQIVPPPQQKKWSDDSEISWTKDSEQVLKIKKGLRDLNSADSNFLEGTRLFINDKLCHNYSLLWNKYKKLWINKQKRMMFVSKIWAKKLYMTIFQKYRLNGSP